MTAFRAPLVEENLPFLHGESTRGEGMPLSYKITAPEARTKKRDTQRVSLFLVPVVGLSRALKSVHRTLFTPVCGLVPGCSSPTQCKRGTAQWAMPLLVPVVGLEPTRCRHQRILSPSRLPIPSHRQVHKLLYTNRNEKSSKISYLIDS